MPGRERRERREKRGRRGEENLRSNELTAECPGGAAGSYKTPQRGLFTAAQRDAAELFQVSRPQHNAPRAGQPGCRTRASLPWGRTEGRCAHRQLRAAALGTAGGQGPQLLSSWEGGKKLHKVVGVRISPRLGPINISNRWNKNNYIPASAFLVYFKCVTAFHFLPRLCFS